MVPWYKVFELSIFLVMFESQIKVYSWWRLQQFVMPTFFTRSHVFLELLGIEHNAPKIVKTPNWGWFSHSWAKTNGYLNTQQLDTDRFIYIRAQLHRFRERCETGSHLQRTTSLFRQRSLSRFTNKSTKLILPFNLLLVTPYCYYQQNSWM